MKKILQVLNRKEFLILTVILVVILIYILFFKPNPIVRLDMNKLKGASASTVLALEAPREVNGVGKTFIVKIKLDTQGNYINAVQSYLYFDPSLLEVVGTNTTQSFCKFYPENVYSNEVGYIKLSCGTPYPGFIGSNTVQEITFYPKAINKVVISLSGESMVLANDGKGTNLLKDLPTAEINIKAGL